MLRRTWSPTRRNAIRDLILTSYASTSFTKNTPLHYAEEEADHANIQ